MNSDNRQSRLNKFEKRRKNTKKISILMIIAGILLLILLAFWIFGGKEKDTTSTDNDIVENAETGRNLDSANQDESNFDLRNLDFPQFLQIKMKVILKMIVKLEMKTIKI